MPLRGKICAAVLFFPAVALAGQEEQTAKQATPGGEQAEQPPRPTAPGELDPFRLDRMLFEEVTTAAGGLVEERSLAAANVYSVSREEIQHHGWHSLAEILASVPGLYLIDDLVISSIGVRGVTGGVEAGTRIVKVMIDGQPVNYRPDLTAFLGPEYIPVEAIERVEIAKGPLSALYGANAFLATVNVITRIPHGGLRAEAIARAKVIRDNGGYGGAFFFSYGSERRGIVGAFTISRLDRSGLAITKTFDSQDGMRFRPFFGNTSQGDVSIPASGFVQLRAGSDQLGVLTIEGGLQSLDSVGEFQLGSVFTRQTRVSRSNIWTSARYENRWSDVTVALSTAYAIGEPKREEQLWLTGTNTSSFRPQDRYYSVDAAGEIKYAPSARFTLRLVGDVDYDVERIRYFRETVNTAGTTIDSSIGPSDARTRDSYDVGVALQVTSAPVPRVPDFRLIGNFRIDKIVWPKANTPDGTGEDEVSFPVQYSWRAAAAYRFENLVTKLVAGRAFQTPSGLLLFARPGFGVGDNLIGNVPFGTSFGASLLKPQSVDSVEVVLTARLLRHVALESSLYFQRISDRIEFIAGGNNFVASNQTGSADQLGFELSSRMAFGRFLPYLGATVLASVTNGKFTIDPPPLYPNTFGRVGADLNIPEIHLRTNVELRWVGPRGSSQSNTSLNNDTSYTLNPYASLDFTLSFWGLRLWEGEHEAEFLVSFRNLTDEGHSEPGFGGFDLPNVGRVVLFEFRQTFSQ